MLPFIAVPVLHSSGAWIASTAAGGYVAGTLSSTWVGAFIAGNSTVLSGLGFISAAGGLTALGGGLARLGAAFGSGLKAVGLGGAAKSLGLAPATFLGLTVAGWSIAVASLATAGVGYFFTRNKLIHINEERAKGGLDPVNWTAIITEVRDYEKQAMMDILEKLEAESAGDVALDRSNEAAVIMGKLYKVSDLKYVIERCGREFIAKRSKIPFRVIILFVVTEESS